ncbi:hypothetical protein CS022_22620 [Veronia nyctiphanis]|uniref:Uncharacterized protein n=1 Tax=Veronia nyctiphanis TaxID=1278244 RepID=A0A4Q0YIX6_9GAMM|nr:hypothetical protein [Veronia nyctiphanis]RXJ70662.1 hypothetical protein CS022_22620 [Veronia nyctiphanis]
MFSPVLDWFGITLPTSFNEMGGNLIDGMVSGITDKLSTAKETVTDTALSIVDWFKETLDIHSPSRVFAEMGGFISQGVGKGISAQAKHAILAISQLGQQLTQSMSSDINMTVATASEITHGDRMQFRPATRPASKPNQAPVQVSITYGDITIESHADKPRELVTLIAQELDRRESQATARIRSRLYDEE